MTETEGGAWCARSRSSHCGQRRLPDTLCAARAPTPAVTSAGSTVAPDWLRCGHSTGAVSVCCPGLRTEGGPADSGKYAFYVILRKKTASTKCFDWQNVGNGPPSWKEPVTTTTLIRMVLTAKRRRLASGLESIPSHAVLGAVGSDGRQAGHFSRCVSVKKRLLFAAMSAADR